MNALPGGFDPQPVLTGLRTRLTPLTAADYDRLYAAARDPAIWAGHPAKNRHDETVFKPYFGQLLASGGTLVVRDYADGEIIGCSRYYPAPEEDRSISIGYTFLVRKHWGGLTNGEIKALMLSHAFDTTGVPHVWFHIGPDNTRSQKATMKIGADYVGEDDLLISGAVARMKSYRMRRAVWRAKHSPCA
jgi:RimJ/RimL family protein N-acetyltransferase